MKRINYILLATLMVCMMCGCGEKKQSKIIIAPKPAVQVKKSTQKMSDYQQKRDVEWVGSTYQVVVKRQSSKELPLVELDENNKYYDNKITVRVLRKDGSEFFNRTFTKSDFSGYLDDHTQKAGALLGIVYVKAEGDHLYFAASVGSPDVTSDEYVPMVVKLSKMGAVSISIDQLLDTDGEGKQTKPSSGDEEEEDGV